MWEAGGTDLSEDLAPHDGLGNWPVSCIIPVQWGDMDAFNHVNHTVFLTWMETARMHYFELCGIVEMLEKEGIGPILAGLKADYSAPVEFPDKVTVRTTVSRLGNSSFDMDYTVTSESKGDKEVAKARIFCVIYDYNKGKPTQIPEAIEKRILEIETLPN